MERAVRIFLLLLITYTGFNCGVYGFRGNNPPAGIRSLAVPTFTDESGSSIPTLPESFTQHLKDEIISDNTFRVADKDIADAVLRCTITKFRDEALVITSGENVSMRKITITVNVVFDNLKKQKNIWTKSFENYGEYSSSNNEQSKRTDGIAIAVKRITDDIVIDLTSDW